MTVATLGFQIDSRQATGAAADLTTLYAAASKMETAADSLTASAGALAGALKRVGDETKKVPPVARPFQDQDEHVRAFRMEVERLTMKYQPLAQATRQYEATVSEIDRAHKMGLISAQQMTQALDRERLAYERLKTSATTAGSAMKAANVNAPRGMGNERAAGINAGYQFQDIAVTAAMGMNPLMIGMQQGTQLASVLATMERPVAGLAAALGSMISPVMLITIGLTAGTAALVQYFTTASDGADGMDADLRAQADLLSSVAERWGDLVPSVREYADELTRAKEQADLLAGIDIVNQRTLESTKSGLSAASVSVADLVSKLQSAGEESGVILDLQNAVNQFNRAAADGTLQIGQVNEVQDALSAALRSTGIPAISDFRSELEKLSDAALKSSKDVSESWREVAAALTSRFPSQGVYDGVERSADGRIMGERYPYQSQTPTRRPSDLDGDPDPTNILNSDGRLVGVPIPGQKPNAFELEKEADAVDDVTKAYRRAQEAKAEFWLDLSFQERQSGRSAMDQRIATTLGRYGMDENLGSPEANALRQQMRGEEAKGLFKGFFEGAYQEAWENGGKIGDALGKSALNAAMKATDKAWDALFDKLAGSVANWFTGGAGQSQASVAAGSGLLATAMGVANDNKSFAAPVGAVARSALPSGDIASYIANAAAARGIDPDVALRVAKSEGGLNSWNLQSNFVKNGVREPSFGPFQLYKGGGLGNDFMRKTGMDPALASSGPAGVDFALDHASKNGWGAWYGADKVGISKWQGIGNNPGAQSASAALEKLASNAGAATEGLGKLGGGLSKLGEGLSTSFFPAAPSAPGGGGGIGGWLSGLFGGGLSAATVSKYTPLTGLFANGTDYAPGGMAMVGERGPELVNLPQGAGVVSNHKLMSALAANNNGGQGGGIAGIRLFVEKDGNWNAKVVSLAKGPARQASAQAVGQYSKQQTRGGFGDTQSVYASDKG